jgi:hypothetical protein
MTEQEIASQVLEFILDNTDPDEAARVVALVGRVLMMIDDMKRQGASTEAVMAEIAKFVPVLGDDDEGKVLQ